MARETEFYHLGLIDNEDIKNYVDAFNTGMQAIDSKLKEVSDETGEISKHVTEHDTTLVNIQNELDAVSANANANELAVSAAMKSLTTLDTRMTRIENNTDLDKVQKIVEDAKKEIDRTAQQVQESADTLQTNIEAQNKAVELAIVAVNDTMTSLDNKVRTWDSDLTNIHNHLHGVINK